MSAISGITNSQSYFQTPQAKAPTSAAGSAQQPASSTGSKPRESAGTRNNDGTYGPRHTIKPPQAADQAQELAAAQVVLSV